MSDHDYEGNGGPCQALVPKYNYGEWHDYDYSEQVCTLCGESVKTIRYENGGMRDYCNCDIPYVSENWVCAEDGKDYMNDIHQRMILQPCGRDSWSVVHPPQGHFCEALENGYDCMHFED